MFKGMMKWYTILTIIKTYMLGSLFWNHISIYLRV